MPLSRNLGTLTSWNPLGLSGPVTGLLLLSTQEEQGAACSTKSNKDRVYPRTSHERPGGGGLRYSSTLSLTSKLDVVAGQRHDPAALLPKKRPGSHCIAGWVGPRADLDGFVKISPPPGFDPRTVQPVESSYTD